MDDKFWTARPPTHQKPTLRGIAMRRFPPRCITKTADSHPDEPRQTSSHDALVVTVCEASCIFGAAYSH
jgi:hypothetical protein